MWFYIDCRIDQNLWARRGRYDGSKCFQAWGLGTWIHTCADTAALAVPTDRLNNQVIGFFLSGYDSWCWPNMFACLAAVLWVKNHDEKCLLGLVGQDRWFKPAVLPQIAWLGILNKWAISGMRLSTHLSCGPICAWDLIARWQSEQTSCPRNKLLYCLCLWGLDNDHYLLWKSRYNAGLVFCDNSRW